VAYPLVPMPTLGEFIARVIGEFGATIHEARGQLTGPRGPVTIRYLWRGASFAVLPDLVDHEPLTPDVSGRSVSSSPSRPRPSD